MKEPEAKSSSEPESGSEMTTSGSPSDQPAPKVEPKVEQKDKDAQWVATIATSIIETINDKKEDNGKPLLPELYEGDQKDTRRFLLDLKVLFRMNPTRYNTDKKKKLTLLLLLKGQT
ncbi:hypothetical protein Moror_12071 [Moniliophthora roreri MCA 2997]|uniref:Reverse transcriptase-rnase h-integrase n=1 Tax=Moniliophthora roreri (strain MCA 2997) TaxID=1381753 RepID=V2WSR2_MONRO|nr:hypothetical protein Moror_12071 [Moniliophthora roreri MCA 2997]